MARTNTSSGTGSGNIISINSDTTPAQVIQGDSASGISASTTGGTTTIKGYKNNFTATTNPGVNNDSSAGYSVGSVWFNKNYAQGGGSLWVCQNSTVGAAVWEPARNAVQVNAAPTVSNDNTQGFFSNFLWLDLSASTAYWCYSAATGAALWIPLMPVIPAVSLRGQWDASGNLFPTTGGTGPGGAVAVGDFWIISVAGTLGGVPVLPGDEIIALVAVPAQTLANWCIISRAFGYIPENSANKSNDTTMAADSATLYPSQHAAKTYSDTKLAKSANLSDVANVQTSRGNLLGRTVLTFTGASFNPADNTPYQFGFAQSAPTTTIGRNLLRAPFTGIIKGFTISSQVNGVLGSSQSSIMYLRVNGVDTLLTPLVVASSAFNTISQFTGVNIPITQGDSLEAKWFTPTWAPNPTQVVIRLDVYIE